MGPNAVPCNCLAAASLLLLLLLLLLAAVDFGRAKIQLVKQPVAMLAIMLARSSVAGKAVCK